MQDFQYQNRRVIVIFLLITFALSSIFYFFVIYTGKLGSGFGLYVTGLMWCPGISALLTSRLFNRNFSLLGWQWGENRYQVWSYLIPLVYVFIAYLLIWIVGWGKFFNIDSVNQISTSFGFDQLPKGLTIVLFFILMGIFGMPGATAGALGEEIGWRGFLVPELYKKMDYTKTSLLTGIIWSVWHYPILLFADYNSGTPAWYGLTCFTALVISISFIYTWFRIKSNSLWTGVLLHASHNLFIQSIFSPLTANTGQTKYFIDEFGAVLPVICSLFAFYFWAKRTELLENKNDLWNNNLHSLSNPSLKKEG